jgi:hypothetical protein
MNVETVTVAAQFLLWEYLFRIFGICSLQCRHTNKRNTVYKKDGQEIAVIGVLADYGCSKPQHPNKYFEKDAV